MSLETQPTYSPIPSVRPVATVNLAGTTHITTPYVDMPHLASPLPSGKDMDERWQRVREKADILIRESGIVLTADNAAANDDMGKMIGRHDLRHFLSRIGVARDIAGFIPDVPQMPESVVALAEALMSLLEEDEPPAVVFNPALSCAQAAEIAYFMGLGQTPITYNQSKTSSAIFASKPRIDAALFTLIENSFYEKAKAIDISIQSGVDATVIIVTDTGSGLQDDTLLVVSPDQQIQSLFQRKASAKPGGTGFGLHHVYDTITSFGGHVLAQNVYKDVGNGMREKYGFQVQMTIPNARL